MERKPAWLKIRSHINDNYKEVVSMLEEMNMNTVCEEALCPNRGECFSKKTATFMILGRNCTRNCTFCNVSKSKPDKVDNDEPKRLAKAVSRLGLKHVVITSVTRDDLIDGGSKHFAKCLDQIRKLDKKISVEVLIPDFKGNIDHLMNVINAKPSILNHNIETVSRLYKEVRKEANYKRSINLLRNSKKIDSSIYTKSGIMLGLGEKKEEVLEVFADLRSAGCDFLTIGQYLSPSKKHHEVIEYVHPDIFEEYKNIAYEKGFKHVASAPFVRSSYNAINALDNI